MPPKGRKQAPAGKVSAESKTSRLRKASVTSGTTQSIKDVKSGMSSRNSRSRTLKNTEEISVNHCSTETRNTARSRRTTAGNAASAKTNSKKTKRAVNSDGTDFSDRSSPLSTSGSGSNTAQSDLSVISSGSENSVGYYCIGDEKELKVVLERFDDDSPKKKIKIENVVCDSVSGNETKACSPSAKISKRERPRKLKKAKVCENGDGNPGTIPKTEIPYSTPSKIPSCEDLSVISGEKCMPHLPDSNLSEMKVESSTCLYDAGEVQVSNSSRKEIKAALKHDGDAIPSTSKMSKRGHPREPADSASSSESEWEEVEEHDEEPSLDDYKPDIPKEGVEITLENPLFKKRYKRKEFDFDGFVRLQINRFKKDVQLALHKVHLLCLLGHGLYVNKILNSCEIQALALSLLPENLISLTKNQNKVDLGTISKVVEWFCSSFTIDINSAPSNNSFQQKLVASFETQKVADPSKHNVVFVAVARTLGISVRLCYSLYPLTFKAKDLLKKKPKGKSAEGDSDEVDDAIHQTKKTKTDAKETASKPKGVKSSKSSKGSLVKKKQKCGESSAARIYSEQSTLQKKTKKVQKKGSKSQSTTQSSSRRPRRSKQNKSYKISSDENEDFDDSDVDKDFVASDDDGADSDDNADVVESGESDSDVSPTIVVTVPQKRKKYCEKEEGVKSSTLQKSSTPTKRNSSSTKKVSKEKNRKILSSDSEESSYEEKEDQTYGIEFWSEIYSKSDKRWIPVETSAKLIDKPYEIEAMAKQPVSYVVVFDNKAHIKDVTKRYCSQFLTVTRKLQADPEWWEETLEPFSPPNNKQNKEEDQQILKNLCNRPLPTTMTEIKNHPLYVIKPHLLKYEAIYPPDAAPVGYLRGEPIYSRDCVVTLRNRETWMKEARVIREGEKPYKMVKSRPKWDKVNRRIIKTEELPLAEVYGFWQTNPFVPPTARDGKVPRNEYGNVELFQPSMLPKGTVHLQIPGLNRIARKLDIDCAPALTGFDVHNLGIHPVFDGFIVCKEFKKTLLDAWDEEQENIRKREEEKREKRIYGNWKKLIKGVLIRERIRVKYALK